MLIQNMSFNIPEPILLQLSQIGNITSSTKQHLYPSFPDIAIAIVSHTKSDLTNTKIETII